ncbi:MAG: site-specific DNA-methyltransferase [Candidatus Hydrothermota bacterium]|nr:MAG: site-specific DNA-methyltransferase [Candidatus Hydrothermae bacterium]
MNEFGKRNYLSAIEVAKYLGIDVASVHELVKRGELNAYKAPSGQYRFRLEDVVKIEKRFNQVVHKKSFPKLYNLKVNSTVQVIYVKDARDMSELKNDSIHLVITSPPYFNAKMYSREPIEGDLGNIHDLDEWFFEISKVWREAYRVLQPGRKAFINVMNLPVRTASGFKSLNIVGRTIDLCEKIGFIFRREIIWHKTNSVRAHFGTYPYPGNILINYAHEFILEFEKPAPKNYRKYAHLTPEQKEKSKLDKEFWLSLKKSDVWLMKPEGSGDRRSHPAPFPYELPYRLIKAFSYVGETVLDPFLGSGTTLVAARDLGRNGVGYEINPEIAESASKKMQFCQTRLYKP